MSMNSKEKEFSSAQIFPHENEMNLRVSYREQQLLRISHAHLLDKHDFKPASYEIACDFRDSLSYKKKLQDGTYKQLGLIEDTNELKAFGLGPYFFIEYQRRIVWLFLVISLMQILRIVITSKSQGLSDYSISYGTFLIRTTTGNYNGNVVTDIDGYLLTIIPFVIYLAFFIFYLIWTYHYNSCISQEQSDHSFVRPEKYCLQIEGFYENDRVKEKELQKIFASFGSIYEVSLIRQHKNQLSYFQELENLQENIHTEELNAKLGNSNEKQLQDLKKRKQQLDKYMETVSIKPVVVGAFIHFQLTKSKKKAAEYFRNHYLFSTVSHGFVRNLCCCCLDQPDPRYLFDDRKLCIKNEKVPEPLDINWDNYEIGGCNKFCRILFSIFIILIFLVLSCTIIGLCSVYVSANSINCDGIYIPNTYKDAVATITSSLQKKCFCNAKLIAAVRNNNIRNYCGVLLDEVYTEQGIQYAIIATSGLVNFLFGLIVDKIITFTRPGSHSSGYLFKTSFYTIFMIFNTVFLPLILYANIFGFKAQRYVSFITLISTDIFNFFNVDSIQLSLDFDRIWYRNVSPIYTNYVIFDIVFTWGFFIYYKCRSNKSSLQNEEGKMLQKTMNAKITSWKFNAYVQYSYFNLIIFICTFFSCGIPVLIPLGFVNLLSKYLVNRSLIQNNSSKIEGLSEKFNSFPLGMLPIMLILSCLFGSWMLTANSQIYPDALDMSIFGLRRRIFARQFYLPFFVILAALILFVFLFYNLVIRFCSWLFSFCCNRKKLVVEDSEEDEYIKEYSNYVKTMSVLGSYNIKSNPKYKSIVEKMDKYIEKNDKQ